MRLAPVAIAATVVCLLAGAQGASAQDPRAVLEDLEQPSAIAFLSDGRMVVNERGGTIVVIAPDRGSRPRQLARIDTVISGETGLLGMAVAPDEDHVYAFATEPDGGSNTVWRIELASGTAERVVEGLPAASIHNGGGLAFDRDGMLLVSHGEQGEADLSQDPAALGGKVYRYTPDGDPAPNGPFEGSAAIAIGLRNPFGLAVDPLTGAPWVTENGPESFDEINRLEPGGNYGWPVVSGPAAEGAEVPDDYRDPVVAYEEIIVPTGITFATYGGPGVKRGDVFFAAYGDGTIRHLRLDADRSAVVSEETIDVDGAVIALTWGPDGLYFTTETSIELIPFEREGGDAEPSPGDGAAAPPPSPDPSSSPNGARDGITSPVGILVLVGLIAAFFWSRYRFERAGDQDSGV
ncbi:MAG TPA: PQQ-dependent sugar dehydrogenase [Actinomycetota bacterium]|nr:PQQ-dependent sugar dehydrogenase [Actinomycetota bacterium]